MIKMADLKSAVEKCGFSGVRTYIQSGNIIFESEDTERSQIAKRIEKCLEDSFHIASSAIVMQGTQLKKIVSKAPAGWKTGKDLRRYIAFIREPSTAQSFMREIEPRQGVDFAVPGDGVVYMSTLLSGIAKTGFTKLVGKPVYKDFTIRNFTTVRKLLEILEK